MIFSRSKSEIYYLLSYLLQCYDIEIIQTIYNKKKELEDIENLKWYIKEGNHYKKYKQGIIINHILFNPYHRSVKYMNIYHKKVFHLKILLETFNLRGFILIKNDNIYNLPSLKRHISILNYFVDKYGVLEIYNKIFQYHIDLTDLVGNRCIRCIISDNDSYIYNTIAINNKNEFIEPVDRLPRLIY